mmetsp:Transcript_9734/g.27983  ORF Transcript_9734/g.27983 Transcript_9734/m.27983 type:complete len:492 (-) Transcript_9734:57-1532(-)
MVHSDILRYFHAAKKGQKSPWTKRHVALFAVIASVCIYWMYVSYALVANRESSLELSLSSKHRLKFVPPTSWTSDDVASWLVSVELPQLRKTFKNNAVNGPILLELSERAIMRDLLITNEIHMKRLLQEIKILNHNLNSSHKWNGPSKPRGAGGPPRKVGATDKPVQEVKLFLVGDNMEFSLDDPAKAPEPTAVLHKVSFLKLRDLVSLATEELSKPVREFVTHEGELVASMEELPDKVYALADGQFFVFPVEKIGYQQSIFLPSADRAVTVTTLSLKPRVFRVEKFLDPNECRQIIEMSKASMSRSTIAEKGNEAKNGYDSARTSSTTWLNQRADPLVARIRQRVADLVKVPMSLAEDLQVLHYAPSQHYWAHHDYFDPSIYRGFVTEAGQNRFITVLFYLSDVEKGGETVFPFAGDDRPVTDFSDCSRGLKVAPKAGDAVIFYSLLAHNHQEACPESNRGCNLDVRSLHGSCDVVRGDKWAANYWISNK